MVIKLRVIGRDRNRLGESPVWDPALKRLFWVDAVAPRLWMLDPASGRQDAATAPDLLGSIVLGEPGFLVAGLRNQVCRVEIATGAFSPILRLADMGDSERLNDGKTDRAGGFVTGSLVHAGEHEPQGKLYRLAPGAGPQVLERGVEISNAICFSPSGEWLYFADSLRQAIWRYPYDAASGRLGARETLVETGPLGSAPDGATVDADGRLWVALVQSGQIACFDPDGRLAGLIDTPVPFPSCPAFGGDEMDVLFVTSISDSGGRLRTDHPDAGRLLMIEGLGVRGIAETRCRL
jgi:sugar lactone lactonase YvrE